MALFFQLKFQPKNLFLLAAGILAFGSMNAQNDDHWLELWQTSGTNFYTIQNAFDSAWAGREAEMQQERNQKFLTEHAQEKQERKNEKLDGTYFQYKRWEHFMEPRVYPSGDLSLTNQAYKNFNDYLNANPAAMMQHNASVARSSAAGVWSFMGPTGAPDGGGAGRLVCVRFEPGNANVIYVGAPSGGLWKSLDAGVTWTCLTDFLPSIGCSDVAIDPHNTSIIYLATGDNDAGDSPSIGVLKSIDGGLTWNTTGLSFNTNSYRRIGKLLMDPTNSDIIYAATSSGIYKTWDAGVNWYRVSQTNTTDMEFKPGDPNTIYSCRVSFYKSTNGGATWTQIASGLPLSTGLSRMAIAVSPAAPNAVYIVTAAANSYALHGVYRSTDSGNTFATQASSPNILGWDPNGGDNTGQGWYDLAIAVSPFNANEVVVGGVNTWASTDAGVSWSLNSHWYGGGAPYVHADCHDIVFDPVTNGKYYICCDGGLFKTEDDGSSFPDMSGNLCIAQIYRGGISTTTHGKTISGHQDNGTNVGNSGTWAETLGGDGMDCFVDRTNDNNMFGELYYGDFHRSTDGGNTWSNASNGTPGNGDWVTPWEQDPVSPNVLYAGFNQLYRSTDLGANWSPVGTTILGTILDLEVAPSNPQCIYASTSGSISRSLDGGVTWTNVGGSISGYAITRIAVSPYDANKIWVSCSGYNVDGKVFFSNNGGTSWANISYGLPNLPADCIRIVPGTSNDAIFVGMDAGVYYHDNSSPGWTPFFTNLPNVPIDDLDIYPPTMKLTAFTYGRGIWEADIDQSLLAPQPDFSATPTVVCPGQSVQFTDLTPYAPTSWNWSFPGGNPSTSTIQNPSVMYSTPGIYQVTLTAGNNAGSGTTTHTSYIFVNGTTALPFVEGFVPTTFLPLGWSGVNVGNQSAFWNRSSTVGHNSSESMFFNNFSYNIPSERDEVHTMGFDFSAYTALTMSFDVAYAKYNSSRSDTLEILASTDCGATWTQIYIKGGSNLSTVSSQTNSFTPANSQWRNDLVPISSFAGQGDVIFSFRNHNHHGNNLWIDNINISGNVNGAPLANFSGSTNLCENGNSVFSDISVPAATSWNWTFPGGNPASSTAQNPSVSWTTAGTYTITLVATNAFGNTSTTQVVTVNSAPVPDAGMDSSYCSATYVHLNASGGQTYSWSPSSGISNPTIASPGIYMTNSQTFTVSVIDANGCSATDSVHVSIHPLPGFSVTGNPLNICLGDTANMFCNNPILTYSWTPSNSLNTSSGDSVMSFPVSSTTYTITAVDTNGCVNSTTKTITVYPPLATPVVLVNGWVLTCSTPANYYQWYLNGVPISGATSQTYTATVVGNYSVEAHSSQNCYSGISSEVMVDGIPQHNGIAFVIAPNPNNGMFDLSFGTTSTSDFVVSIFSADGKLVYLEELPEFSGTYQKQIDISSFGSGMYLIKLTNDKQQSVQHIIVF
jgi:PKD repeat protein